MQTAQIFLTDSFHPFLSDIALGKSFRLYLVSTQSYVSLSRLANIGESMDMGP